MQLNLVALIFILASALGALIREIIGNKGVFILPKLTDKGLALGSLTAIIIGLGVGIGQILLVVNVDTIIVAGSLGFGTGLGYTDLIANIIAFKYEKKNGE